ncbi:PQQ-like domain-containing protein [Streptomyces zhaozhouensis]|uniref:PQQ-like domain-containing protein n=1 Tax=Streptomyces zhaozhouensis TaxID=1300267 RepID=A0A286DXT4_9ACTN|nr:PQQ-binding-like beta-propeller repeat protein [Streptomyces zhaozhouensis]SOD63478.1 PQQ-like domain-containing protein [Streptomyces zhaozhouensis]
MSQPPPPPNQPPGPPGERPEQPPAAPGGFGPPATPPPGPPGATPSYGTPPATGGDPGTPPSSPAVPPQGQPGQPGYGYPQTPPAGGYGFPQGAATPPPPAGYGFPPGGATPPPSGYGFPPGGPASQQPTLGGGFAATPPAPYGAPPTAGGQAGFGATYGGPGGAVPPPGSPGAGGGKRPPAWMLVLGVVLVVLLAGGGTYFFVFADDDKETTANRDAGGDGGEAEGEGEGEGEGGGGSLPSEPIQASLAWETPPLEVAEGDNLIRSGGAWFVDDAVVRVLGDELISYDLATGQENWKLPFEMSGGNCNASPNVDENRVAILQGRDCEVVSVVDISAGEEIASIPLNSSVTPDRYQYPAILGDTVAVSWGIGGGLYQISTGEQLFVSSSEGGGECVEVSYMVVEQEFVSLVECGWLGDEGGSVRATNEAGDPSWEWEFTDFEGQEMDVRSVLSVSPLTLVVHVGDSLSESSEKIVVINEERTEIQHVLDYDTDRYLQPCENQVFPSCALGVVHEDYLYLATNDMTGDNAVVAFNLSTGLAEYEAPAINGGQIRPFAEQDGKILAYQPATSELEGMVVALDPAAEELSPVMALDRAALSKEYGMMGSGLFAHDSLPMWHENTLVLNDRVVYESEESPPSVLAYR